MILKLKPLITQHKNSLKLPPYKYGIPKKLPDKLILQQYTDYFGETVDRFVMFSTKKSESGKYATMKCFPEFINRDGKKNVPSLYVWYLSSNCSGSGFGTAMLNFAKKYSKKLGCEGNLHLSADVGFTPNRVPHIFYYKYGMNTKNPAVNKKLKSFIQNNKQATWKDFENIDMYYPPINFPMTMFEKAIYKTLKFGLKTVFGIKI